LSAQDVLTCFNSSLADTNDIYGYLNRIQSSRRLEREAQRNIELMWMTGHYSDVEKGLK
jgi:hypothetical protein